MTRSRYPPSLLTEIGGSDKWVTPPPSKGLEVEDNTTRPGNLHLVLQKMLEASEGGNANFSSLVAEIEPPENMYLDVLVAEYQTVVLYHFPIVRANLHHDMSLFLLVLALFTEPSSIFTGCFGLAVEKQEQTLSTGRQRIGLCGTTIILC